MVYQRGEAMDNLEILMDITGQTPDQLAHRLISTVAGSVIYNHIYSAINDPTVQNNLLSEFLAEYGVETTVSLVVS